MNCNRFYSQSQVDLMNCLRTLWEQHVMWTKSFIISTAAELDDLEPVTKRLLRNPDDFACVLEKYYSKRCSERFKELFTEHLLIGGDLVNAVKDGETDKIPDIRKQWYENADDIACFFGKINPFWSARCWRDMLYSHLKMTAEETELRINGKYADDIKIYSDIECEAMKMADYMTAGIIRQCRV